MRFSRFLKLTVFCLLTLSLQLDAGVTEGRKLQKPSGEVQFNLSTDPRFRLARQLMSSRDFQAAADVLETLYEIDPDNLVISNSLKSCYEHLKQYAKGELLLKRLIKKFPGNVSYQLNLAESLIGQGKLDEGKKIYNDLLSQVDPKRPGAPASVIRSMVQADLEEDALAAILELRKISNDSTVIQSGWQPLNGNITIPRENITAVQNLVMQVVDESSPTVTFTGYSLCYS